MFWAAFGFGLRTELIALEGDPASERGGVTGRVIRDLYAEQLPRIIRPGDTFMHDNAPVHGSHLVTELLENLDITVMIWPPYSPDLNPEENVWPVLKNKTYDVEPRLVLLPNNNSVVRDVLVPAAKEAWRQIPTEMTDKLALEMRKRVNAVIQAEGWYTKY